MFEKIAAKLALNKGGDIIGKVMEGADNLFTSKEEKMKLQNELTAEVNKAIAEENANTLELLKAELGDMSNARQREIDLAKDEHTPMINKIITPILGLLIVCSTFAIWAMILFRHYEPKTSESMIIGSLTTICASVISYYFGSSTGAHRREKTIENLMKK